MRPSPLNQAAQVTSRQASAHTLFYTRRLLLRRAIKWLGAALLSGVLLVVHVEGIRTPPKSNRDWWGTLIEIGLMLFATYKAQLYNESALVTGLAMDQQLNDEPFTEVLVKAPVKE